MHVWIFLILLTAILASLIADYCIKNLKRKEDWSGAFKSESCSGKNVIALICALIGIPAVGLATCFSPHSGSSPVRLSNAGVILNIMAIVAFSIRASLLIIMIKEARSQVQGVTFFIRK